MPSEIKYNEPLVIWDDAQLLRLEKGLPKDRPVFLLRRMWDIRSTMNGVLDMLDKDYPNVRAVCCILDPQTERIGKK